MMKPYLVDVPVKTNIWIRPECQRRQFEIIKKARPSILFLMSDGGRNDEEWEAIYQNRKMYDEEVDWDCTIYKRYADRNYGMYTFGKSFSKFVWSKVDRCIFLEDDILPSVSFFRYCAEMLEKYKDDTRVSVICGMNHEGISQNVNSDYFFAERGSIWGTAMWKRTHERYDDFEYGKDSYVMGLLKEETKKDKNYWKTIQGYAKGEYYDGHVAGAEFFLSFSVKGQHQLRIIPKRNMISNIGCTDNAAHSMDFKKLSKGIRQVFNMQTYEMEFPIKHAKYVIPDRRYVKKLERIMGWGHPFVQAYRRIEVIIKYLIYDDFKSNLGKVKKRIKRKKRIET